MGQLPISWIHFTCQGTGECQTGLIPFRALLLIIAHVFSATLYLLNPTESDSSILH